MLLRWFLKNIYCLFGFIIMIIFYVIILGICCSFVCVYVSVCECVYIYVCVCV